MAARSNARLASLEAEIAGLGTDPSKDPTRDLGGVYRGDPEGKLVGVEINMQTPAARDRELQQYLENTPQRLPNEGLPTQQLPVMDPTMRPTNAPDTYTGKGLIRVVPSVLEHTLATNPSAVGGAVGTAVGGLGGAKTGGVAGAIEGVTIGGKTGAGLGESIGGPLANKLLDPRRQSYYGEQLNFIAAVRGEETSRLSPETIEIERKRFFPQPGDTEAEVLRKRTVREDAVSGMATQTNRPQGMVPRGQTQLPTPSAPTFSMDDVRKTAQVTGRSVDEVLADASRRKIVIR
jgi:hypothetical protein